MVWDDTHEEGWVVACILVWRVGMEQGHKQELGAQELEQDRWVLEDDRVLVGDVWVEEVCKVLVGGGKVEEDDRLAQEDGKHQELR